MLLNLKFHLSLLSFGLTFLQISNILSTVSSWSLPRSSKPAIKISLSVQNTLGNSWTSLSIFFWNRQLVGATQNDSLVYLYLPNGQENVVKQYMIACLASGCNNLNVHWDNPCQSSQNVIEDQPPCTGQVSTLLNFTGLRHSHTVPLALGTRMKLLHHSDVLPASSGTDILFSAICLGPL